MEIRNDFRWPVPREYSNSEIKNEPQIDNHELKKKEKEFESKDKIQECHDPYDLDVEVRVEDKSVNEKKLTVPPTPFCSGSKCTACNISLKTYCNCK